VTAPAASVIVPTRDRPEALAACLDALRRQTMSAFEVIVVDDASIDASGVADVVATLPNARVVRGDGRGPAAARNLGAEHARARIVCFTDDDCRVSPGWVDAYLSRIEHGATAADGPTHNGLVSDPYATAAQTITNHLMTMSLDATATRVGFAPTCNLACRADLLREQPFDESYPLAAGEDRDWCARLGARGIDIAFEPRASVTHVPALSLGSFWNQQQRYGRGAYRFHRARPRGARLQTARFYLELVRAGFDLETLPGDVVLLAQGATALGMLREAVAARRAST